MSTSCDLRTVRREESSALIIALASPSRLIRLVFKERNALAKSRSSAPKSLGNSDRSVFRTRVRGNARDSRIEIDDHLFERSRSLRRVVSLYRFRMNRVVRKNSQLKRFVALAFSLARFPSTKRKRERKEGRKKKKKFGKLVALPIRQNSRVTYLTEIDRPLKQ